ncbi:Helix-turn-helix conjugative transposon-like domain-containing protein, partial [Dysosmobacter welbionis]
PGFHADRQLRPNGAALPGNRVDEPHSGVHAINRLTAVIRLQCHCAVTAGNCRAVNIIAIEINGHTIIYSTDAGGEHETFLQ